YESNGIPFGVALAQIQTESVCDENARSSAGALGLTQVMPRTAKYTLNIDPNDLQNPETSIQAGSRYTGMMIDKLNGKLWLGVIAHNSGDRPVKRWIGRVEKPKDQVEYEDINIRYGETRRYGNKIRGLSVLHENPEKWNLYPSPRSNGTEKISLERSISMRQLKMCLNTDTHQLLNLNPGFRQPDELIEKGTIMNIPGGREDMYNKYCVDSELLDFTEEMRLKV
ncbi:lytic transglycosylase domain-containing protein, partial [Candidatus Woesearchaeota archaeon]|nr:lytic transglycosylase domain-containing protein [Candidatus Woesearchaeota archaeon]